MKSGARGSNGARYTMGTDIIGNDNQDGYSTSITIFQTTSEVVISAWDMLGDDTNNRLLIYKT